MSEFWKSRYEHEDQYGDTLWSMGVLNFVDGQPYIDSISLTQYLKEHEGKVVAFEFVFGLPKFDEYKKLDTKIAPLVDALRSRGVRTLHCCEGHMEPGAKYSYLCPQVDFPVADSSKVVDLVPATWQLYTAPWGDPAIVRLRPRKDAESQAELEAMQEEALGLAKTLAQ